MAKQKTILFLFPRLVSLIEAGQGLLPGRKIPIKQRLVICWDS